MIFEQLRPFKIVAWDFDGTIDDHHRAEDFHRFIRDNPFGQTHHIVTFRSHGMQDMIWPTLGNYADPCSSAHFGAIHNLSDEMYESYHSRQALPFEEACRVQEEFLNWKGSVCKQIGAEVLIDDMRDLVTRGCSNHGIAYFHPSELF